VVGLRMGGRRGRAGFINHYPGGRLGAFSIMSGGLLL
jgi:hypothetical protein